MDVFKKIFNFFREYPLVIVIACAIAFLIYLFVSLHKDKQKGDLKEIEKLKRAKGREGEKIIKDTLSTLNKTKFTVFHDVILPFRKNRTNITQIDHIVISPYGIFVVETKNWKTPVTGVITDGDWYDEKGNAYFNPVIQNDRHIQALKEVLINKNAGLKRYVMYSVIVFNPDATINLTGKEQKKGHVYITKYDKILGLISSADRVVYTREEVRRITKIIRRVK